MGLCGAVVADARLGGFDALYLDLHGAAVAEHVDDAEGELLERLRKVVGPVVPRDSTPPAVPRFTMKSAPWAPKP